jgi:hypothetical protein
MKRHSKDWYFAAASANDMWATAHGGYRCEKETGASLNSCFQLWTEMTTKVSTEADEVDSTYIAVQYGLEKAGLICKERRKKGKS